MRTNIVSNNTLMSEARRVAGLSSKPEVVELGLRTLQHLRKQEDIRAMRGKFNWTGDLEAMRADR